MMIKITDEILELAVETYLYAGNNAIEDDMKAALEAVFDYIGNHSENPNSSGDKKEPEEKPYCAGENCNATKENITHSVECMFEHFLAYTGDSAATPLFKAQLKRAYLHGRDSTKPKNLFCAAEDSPDFGLSDFEIFYCRICKNSILYQGQICKGREEKKEPKKQTLWEYIADEKDLRPKDLENYEIIDLISEYLEQNK